LGYFTLKRKYVNINITVGTNRGCMAKLSLKLKVSIKIPALVIPQKGHGTPINAISGQKKPKK